MPSDPPVIYPASKLYHARMWRTLRDQWTGVEFSGSWVDAVLSGVEDTPENAREYWPVNVEEIYDSDLVLVYHEPDDDLAGALVEAGIGLALNYPVLVVGNPPGTWKYHPLVIRFDTLDAAYQAVVSDNLNEH